MTVRSPLIFAISIAIVSASSPASPQELTQSTPAPLVHPGASSRQDVTIKTKFRVIVSRPDASGDQTDVQFDYASTPPTPLEIEGVGPVAPAGTLRFLTRRHELRFIRIDSGAVVASYNLPDEIAKAQLELASIGFSPAQRLRRTELLHLLGEDSVAIKDLAVLASAPSLPTSTRDYASLQLGNAFESLGNSDAALAQYARVSGSTSATTRAEALVRESDLQLVRGNEAEAERSITAYKYAGSSTLPEYKVRAQAIETYLSLVKASPKAFSSTTPLISSLDRADSDQPKESDFRTDNVTFSWHTVSTYPTIIGRMWNDIFRGAPGDGPCRPGLLCTTTPSYWDLRGGPFNGRFARIALRVSRWYPGDSPSIRNSLRIEYAAQEESEESIGTWTPAAEPGVTHAIRAVLDDFEDRLRLLGET